MAYIKSGSLRISPPNPTDADQLEFTFTGAIDAIDTLSLFGFDTIFHILYKKTGTSAWDELLAWKCADCFNKLCPEFAWGTSGCDFALTLDQPLKPHGTYDFMVIDDGDYRAKIPPYDTSRIAVRNSVSIIPYVDPNQPSLEISVTQPDAEIDVDGSLAGYGDVSYPVSVGQTVQIVIKKVGYAMVSISHVVVPGANIIPLITLSACGASEAGCYGGGTTVIPTTKTCDGLSRGGSFDPTCILDSSNSMYLYGAIGLVIVLLLVTGGKKK
jgi:hypothetical protein